MRWKDEEDIWIDNSQTSVWMTRKLSEERKG
jgi:hypothetical protein